MNTWFKSGSPWIWLSAGGVSISLISVVGLLWLIASRGLSYFWPSDIYQFDMVNQQGKSVTVIGEIYDREEIPASQLAHLNIKLDPAQESIERYLIKTGNRELVSLDFRWILVPEITKTSTPENIAVIERRTNGNFYGVIEQLVLDGKTVSLDQMPEMLARVSDFQVEIEALQKVDIGAINYQIERLRLKERKHRLKNTLTDDVANAINNEVKALQSDYQVLEDQLMALRKKVARDQLLVKAMDGTVVTISFEHILHVSFNNQMTVIDKLQMFFVQIANFITDDPREANTEGGVFPAIFGTVLMVLLMTVIVSPLGVVAAIYLHEYAKPNMLTRLVRIAVINLAGVPSIVYGVFGLGFFVYVVGGTLDQIFYSNELPTPTFGTPGLLWSALTLAILTLPVVIVATEEGLSRIPNSVRHGSLALGATQFETLWKIVLPMASPAIMTGLILAVARAAGEVAPLMLVGVVKLAPSLPVDAVAPYLHLDRKFMHLGYHIYDVAFQSPNVEAARPLVYATSFLLVTVIISLNLTAIAIRNYLREKFRALEQ
mgnify:CR=1 FL=1